MKNNVIGFDMNGADLGMDSIAEGLSAYIKESKSQSTFKLFGDKEQVLASLKQAGLEGNGQIQIIHTTQVIENSEEPALALRKKKDSSIVVGGKALKSGDVDAFVSSGSTGALVASGIFVVGRLDGIDRPALGGLVPRKGKRPVLLLDLGANVEAKAEHLVQYAMLGSKFVASYFNVESPSIGLLNVGSEDGKGNALYKEAFHEIKKTDLNFSGNVEARDVFTTDCDVLVIDGFSGNILLKSIEGTVAVFNNEMKQVFMKSALSKLSALVVKNGLKEMKSTFDYRDLGATPVFGVNGLLLKAHGSSDAKAFKNAFRSADEMLDAKYIENLKEQ